MSFSASLEFGSEKYVILDVDYEFTQPMDVNNRPNGKPKGGIINISIESSKKNDLLEWMLSPDMKKSGTIAFTKRDSEAILKTIYFDDAFCVRYRERFSSNGTGPMILHLTISAGHISINKKFRIKNAWSNFMNNPTGMGQDAVNASLNSLNPADILEPDNLRHPNRVLEEVDIKKGAGVLKDEATDATSDLQDSGALDQQLGPIKISPKPTELIPGNEENHGYHDGLPGVSFS